MPQTTLEPQAQSRIKTITELENECVSHMLKNEFYNVPLPLDLSGKTVKFVGRNEANGKEKTEWYIASEKENGKITVTYNSHHATINRSKNYVFSSKYETSFDEEETRAQRERVAKMQQKRDQEDAANEELKQKKAARDRDRFNKSTKEGKSAYVVRKQIEGNGLRYEKSSRGTVALVPMYDEKGEIQALQEIFETKRLIGESKKERDKNFTNASGGLFFIIGTPINGQLIRVSEGYATAESCYISTEHTIPHVVAFSDLAYSRIIPIIRNLYPDSHIQICADNNLIEGSGKESTGIIEAKKAMKETRGCSFVYPRFCKGKDRDENGKTLKDFNDLMIIAGKEEVAKQLNQPMGSPLKLKKEQPTPTVQEELKKLASTLLEKEEPCGNFTTKDLPKQLREYIDAVCSQSDAHPIMIASSVLSSIAGILKKRLFIPKGEYFQTLYPNLWMINLYKSGGFKSTAMENGANIARGMSKEIMDKIKQLEKQLRSDKSQKERLENEKLKESLEDVILPNKITSEALLQHLSEGHSGVILTGEFGAWLQNMDTSNNGDLKGIFTELYDVPPCYRYKTKGQGDHILEMPCFSICGVSTLAWLKDNLKPNDVTSGFFARFLLFTPPHSEKIPSALPTLKKQINPHAKQAIIDTLNNMSDTYEYKLSPSARNTFELAHASLYAMTKAYSDKCQEILDPYLKRWSPYILKLAMIMQLFEDPLVTIISDTAINAAMAVLLPAIKSTAQLFEGELGESDQQRKSRLIYEWICKRMLKSKPPTWAALITSNILDGGAAMYEYPMKTLVEGGKVNEIQKPPNKRDWLYVPNSKEVG